MRSTVLRHEQGHGAFVAEPKLAQGPREMTSFTDERNLHNINIKQGGAYVTFTLS